MEKEERENSMYNVTWKNAENVICKQEFDSLTLAMEWAKEINCFVTITGNNFEAVGMFGVDSVKNGKCPDGVTYDWNKSSRIGRVKRERG